MAFIPSSELISNNVGKFLYLNRDVSAIKGTITKGSRVLVTGVTERGYDIVDVESSEPLIECGFNIFD